jgi:hypothetical protein
MRLADIEVVDPDGNVVLLAEIKSRSSKDSRWASEYRRNLAAHGHSLGKYLLIVTRDDSYLWRNGDSVEGDLRGPDSVAPTRVLLGPNLGAQIEGELSGTALEHLVAAWLSSVANSASVNEVPPDSRSFLVDSGLWSALRDGNVRVA